MAGAATPLPFPSALYADLSAKLSGHASGDGKLAAAHLSTIAERVCKHAHESGMSVVAMVIALHHLYDAVIPANVRYSSPARRGYDRLLSACLKAYFRDQQRPES
jgi:hypothetical protein